MFTVTQRLGGIEEQGRGHSGEAGLFHPFQDCGAMHETSRPVLWRAESGQTRESRLRKGFGKSE